jgi:RNA polymerase subunit RPABC4/transcription elongation factor Spt4
MPFRKKEMYSDAPTCTNCDAVYPRDARFCPNCGEGVKVPPAPAPQAMPEHQEFIKPGPAFNKHLQQIQQQQVRQDSSHCPQCGRLNSNTWESCPYCGTRLIKAAKNPRRRKSELTTEQKLHGARIVGDMGLLGMGPLGWFFLGRRQNKRKQDAQQQRIESLLREIRDKK